MEDEQKIFSLIVKNSIFAYLKEKYPHTQIDDGDDNDNIIKIIELLKQLERYAHIPDKQKIIKDEYLVMKSLINNQDLSEAELLQTLQEQTQNITQEDKNYILNSVIFVTNEDDNISSTEKEIIIQIARFLDISHDYKTIMKEYHKSEFVEEKMPIITIIIGLLILAVIAGGLFWQLKKQSNTNIFETDKYQFDQIHFNRYVMYKNSFEVFSGKFHKYFIAYISGVANVSFNPQKLQYNSKTKTLTLSENNFDIESNFLTIKDIDTVNPDKISTSEARKIGAVVGLASGYAGIKAGNSLANFLPKKIQLAVSSTTALVAGGAGYFVTSELLDGLQLSSDITETEKTTTKNIAKSLIDAQLKADEELQKIYKKHFEQFIKAKYKTHNIDIKHIKYGEAK
jgi:hypothetical protein